MTLNISPRLFVIIYIKITNTIMTEQITNIPDKGNKKRIVIVGGGFGGLKIARKLKRQHYQVVLLDKNNYHLFQPLLYQVATSGIEPVLFHSHSARYSKDTKTSYPHM